MCASARARAGQPEIMPTALISPLAARDNAGRQPTSASAHLLEAARSLAGRRVPRTSLACGTARVCCTVHSTGFRCTGSQSVRQGSSFRTKAALSVRRSCNRAHSSRFARRGAMSGRTHPCSWQLAHLPHCIRALFIHSSDPHNRIVIIRFTKRPHCHAPAWV